VSALSDATLEHLRRVADWPEMVGGRYRVLEKIGSGGMGSIYLAHDAELQRNVCIKVLHSFDDPLFVERIRSEARILARLEHPGIIPVHDVGTLADGRIFYVMKHVRGHSLDEHAAHLNSLPEALQLFERICEPIAFAHAQGIIHRDLKPENVMVGSFGEVLVLDWGVAKISTDPPPPAEAVTSQPPREGITAPGTILGTPGYMAPEQARGDQDAVDARADVHALGAVLHFLLTGQLSAAPASGAPESLKLPRWAGAVPRPLKAICKKAMAPEPRDRYPSVTALSEDVSRFLAGARVLAHAESGLEKAQRFASKYRTPILLVLAYLLMRLVGLLIRRG